MDYLNAYLAIDRRHSIANNSSLPDRTNGTVLFADISGFSPLAATLADTMGSHRGSEELNHQINNVFTAVIENVRQFHGSVVSFGGDAITCWFDHDNGVLGTACALAMQQTMHSLDGVHLSDDHEISLHVKVAVVCGSVRRFIVGDKSIQLIDVLAGELLDRVAAAEHCVNKREIIVGAEIVRNVGDKLKVNEWRTADNGESFAVINSLQMDVAEQHWVEPPMLPATELNSWLLEAVYRRLVDGQGSFLSDLRLVTPLFVSFSGIDYDSDPNAHRKLNQVVCWLQQVADRYDGNLFSLSIGDKGSFCAIVFGAPVTHEEDTHRAVTASMNMISPPTELDFLTQLKIGISCGQVHAGAYGGTTRSTYGIFGEDVNLCARLMTHAQDGQILVTPRVAESVSDAFQFEAMGPAKLKGFIEPIVIYRLDKRRSAQNVAINTFDNRTPLLGRSRESDVLSAGLAGLQDIASQTILIEGDAGIGKSRLISDLFSKLGTSKVSGLIGAGDAIEIRTAYHTWRPIFRQLYDKELRSADGSWELALEQILAFDSELAQLAPLLNVVLPLAIPENALTSEMSGSLRAFNTSMLLVKLLEHATAQQALLIVIEDAHWMDSASWELLSRVSQRVEPLLLVVATRPIKSPPREYQQLKNLSNVQLLQLDTLEEDAIAAIVSYRLGVESLSMEMSEFINNRASGNPFYSEELALALRDKGIIQVVDGVIEVKEGSDLNKMDFPDTIQGVIISRIDELPAPPQLTLKIASIIGRVFEFSILSGIHPVANVQDVLNMQFDTLCDVDLVRLESPEPELTYLFKHIITQEVAYNLMTFSQRRSLHEKAAKWYEEYYLGDQDPDYPMLAHHWSLAEVSDKAIDSLDNAGNQALQRGAFREAILFLNQAYDLSTLHKIRNDSLQLARWKADLGIANLKIGNLKGSRENLEASLQHLNRPLPDNVVDIKKGLKKQTQRQFFHRMLPFLFLGSIKNKQLKEESLVAARAYEHLGQLFYHNNDPLSNLYTSVNVLNLAERSGPSPQLTRAYGQLTLVTSIMNRKRLSKMYSGLAKRSMSKSTPLTDIAMTNEFVAIALAGVGRWPEANKLSVEAMEISERIGDHRRWNENISMNALTSYPLGEAQASLALREKLFNAGLRDNDVQIQGWGLLEQAEVAIHRYRMEDAQHLINSAKELGPVIGRPEEIWLHGMCAVVSHHMGNSDLARESAMEAYNRLSKAPPTAFYVLEGYAGTVEVFTALWQNSNDAADFELAQEASRHLSRFAAVFTIAAPRAALWQGILSWHSKPAQAVETWQQGLEKANTMGMVFEAALLQLELAKHNQDSAVKQSHYRSAKNTLEKYAAHDRLKNVGELS